MQMTWIEMWMLLCALCGVALAVWPEPRRARVAAAGRLITGHRSARLECARFVRYGARGESSFSDGI